MTFSRFCIIIKLINFKEIQNYMKTNNISPELSSKEIRKIIEDIKKDYAFLNLSVADLIEICNRGGGIRK